MTKHEEKARMLFLEGYNCAQAVYAAFCDVTGVDAEDALRLSSSFGGGIGRLREVCGAVSGMAMVAGAVAGYSEAKAPEKKDAHYALIQRLCTSFKTEFGSYICRELLALPTGPYEPTPAKRNRAFYQRRPCADFVAGAARILDAWLEEREAENHGGE